MLEKEHEFGQNAWREFSPIVNCASPSPKVKLNCHVTVLLFLFGRDLAKEHSFTEAYNRACAVTQEHSLPALEAAHIRPFAKEGPHEVRNGLLLRADLHRLFEQGYLTVTPEYTLDVSDRLQHDYHNGKSYYPLRG